MYWMEGKLGTSPTIQRFTTFWLVLPPVVAQDAYILFQ
jgi:hypothetical protein